MRASCLEPPHTSAERPSASFRPASSASHASCSAVRLLLLLRSQDSTPWPPTDLLVRNDEIRPQSAAALHLMSVHDLRSGCSDDGRRKSFVTQAIPTPSVSSSIATPRVPEPPDPPTITGAVYQGAAEHECMMAICAARARRAPIRQG
jgi:hypothetical protein